MQHLKIGFLLAPMMLAACDSDGDGRYFERTTVCSDDAETVSILEAQLKELGTDYEWVNDSSCIEYSSEGDIEIRLAELNQSSEIESFDYPENYAPGRSASWGGRNSELRQILAEAGVEYFEYEYGDIEWIGWSLQDVEKVETLLDYSDARKASNKETREYFSEYNPPNN